jgi:hypothetical protein
MVKKNVTEVITKLRGMIEGNDAISTKLQTKILKQVDLIAKKVKVPVKRERGPDEPIFEFEKPFPVDDAMADFAGWDRGSSHSRVDITKMICAYIKTHQLQNPENKRIIVLDADLKTLLGVVDDTITYPRIQKYIGQHFIKPPKPLIVVAATVADLEIAGSVTVD